MLQTRHATAAIAASRGSVLLVGYYVNSIDNIDP